MKITYYKVINDKIIPVSEEINPKDWNDKIDWIKISSDSRKEVAEYFLNLNRYNDNFRDCIECPENFPLSNTFEENVSFSLPVSNATDIYKTDYISVIVEKKLVITIASEEADYFDEKNISTYSEKKYPTINYFLFHVLMLKVLAQNNINVGLARKRMKKIEQIFTKIPDKLSSNDLMLCEQQINQLSDIIEDQYLGAQIQASLSSLNLRKEDILQTNKLLKGFDPLEKAMLRLEKRAKSLRLHYLLLQQEKSTRKINVLTIIQAIFVPLTFIAGVYGMNFTNMPELEWPAGYLLVWILFIGMASVLLNYFYRKGWFN